MPEAPKPVHQVADEEQAPPLEPADSATATDESKEKSGLFKRIRNKLKKSDKAEGDQDAE